MKTGFDLSNFDQPFDATTVAALQAGGMQWAIVGCQRPAIATMQVAALQAAGVPVIGTYAFLYWGLDTTGQTQAAIDVAKAHGIPYVWLDCEAEGKNEAVGETPDSRTAQLRACVAMVEASGLKAGIYTGAYYWGPAMGTTEFARLPLWHASYYSDRRYQPMVDYGGWTNVAIHQYASTPELAGRNRDYDVLFDWFEAAVFTKEDELAQADIDRITALETDVKRLSRALFSGAEESKLTDGERNTNVAYRIAQRNGDATDQTTMPSVAEDAYSAAKGTVKALQMAGMTDDEVRAIVGDELANAHISITPGGAK